MNWVAKCRFGLKSAMLFLAVCLGGNTAINAKPMVAKANMPPPNILFLIADDLGKDALSCYGKAPGQAQTPNLDALCRRGVKFTRAWGTPTCTPSRTAILTGRHGFRTGSLSPSGPIPGAVKFPEGTPKQISDNQLIVHAVQNGKLYLPDDAPILVMQRTGKPPAIKSGAKLLGDGPRDSEVTLPAILAKNAAYRYATAAIGKWHLSNSRPDLFRHPNIMGFDHYSGNMFGSLESYYYHSKISNGESKGWESRYATSAQVDMTLQWISQQKQDQPWFLWLAFNAPHDPYHKPPNELISAESQKLDPNGITAENASLYHRAMIEALDHELGRLLNGIDKDVLAKTYVVFLGDNGTVGPLIKAPYKPSQGKQTMFEGGINIPLIVDGPNIKSHSETAMINLVDLLPTFIDLAGVKMGQSLAEMPKIDGYSFANLLNGTSNRGTRKYNLSEQKGWLPTGYSNGTALTDGRYKIIIDEHTGSQDLYDLSRDPYETTNLLTRNKKSKYGEIVNKLKNKIIEIRGY